MRLDAYLVERGMASGRDRAKELILNQNVTVNNITASKPSQQIAGGDEVCVLNAPQYVSRGGLKLEKALDVFGVELGGRVCMDIGASTGGFTHCMLTRGAARVYAVDVGAGQLAPLLRGDARVVSLERTNIRTLSWTHEAPDFIAADVSFISLRYVTPVISRLLGGEGACVCLVKPQFEAGRENIRKGGIVRGADVHVNVLNSVIHHAALNGLHTAGLDYSPIRGGKGNIEYLIYLNKTAQHKIDPVQVVNEALQFYASR